MSVPIFLHDLVGMLDHRHAIREGDVLIAVSFAPYSEETLDLAQGAKLLRLPMQQIARFAYPAHHL